MAQADSPFAGKALARSPEPRKLELAEVDPAASVRKDEESVYYTLGPQELANSEDSENGVEEAPKTRGGQLGSPVPPFHPEPG